MGLVDKPKVKTKFFEARPPRSKSRLKFKRPKVKLVDGVADDALEYTYWPEDDITSLEPRKLPK